MIVQIHIEHLVVDGGPLRRGDGDAVASALAGELQRLLGDTSTTGQAAVADAPTALAARDWKSPQRLGTAAAQLVHAEVTSTPGLGGRAEGRTRSGPTTGAPASGRPR
jgi:hypothetical protein